MKINQPLTLWICDIEKNEQENLYILKISPPLLQKFHKALIRGTPDNTLIYFNHVKSPPKAQTKKPVLQWALGHSKILRRWHRKKLIKQLGIPIKK